MFVCNKHALTGERILMKLWGYFIYATFFSEKVGGEGALYNHRIIYFLGFTFTGYKIVVSFDVCLQSGTTEPISNCNLFWFKSDRFKSHNIILFVIKML